MSLRPRHRERIGGLVMIESRPSGRADHERITTYCPRFPAGRCCICDYAGPGNPRSRRPLRAFFSDT